jgi:hypothetical protein
LSGHSKQHPNPAAPNFFLVGAPKAGTTALYRYLTQHPGIYMSPIKEPHFLADEIRLGNFTDAFRKLAESRLPAQTQYLKGPVIDRFSGGPIPDWSDYLKLFQGATVQTAIGEASVCYLWSPSAPANMASHFPHSRILMVLRNPVERAFTQYAHMLTFADKCISFREYVDAAMQSDSTRIGELYPFLRFGLYHEQLTRYMEKFDSSRIQVHFYEDYRQDPRKLLQSIYRFLNVDPAFEADLSERHMEARVPRSFYLKRTMKRFGVWNKVKDHVPDNLRRRLPRPRGSLSLSPVDRNYLVEYYRDDIGKLSQLLDRDLTHWLRLAV